MFRTVRIRDHERGLWFRNGNLHRVLASGQYRFLARALSLHSDEVEISNTLDGRFDHPMLDVLVKSDELRSLLEVVELAESDRALVWTDGRFSSILGPGRYAYWKVHRSVEVERFSIDDFWFRHPQLDAILGHRESLKYLTCVDVKPETQTFLLRDGDAYEELSPGRHVYWNGTAPTLAVSLERREQSLDVAGQEIMTSDKVTLRVNLYVTHRIVDGRAALQNVQDHSDALYREAQLALRAAVGRRKLDALLADKEVLVPEIRKALEARASEFGVQIVSVGLRDVILPGDMKTILNQVIEAEKKAQANLIRRREETAAARSQANTAKLIADHPTLLRLRELEMLGELLAGTRATFVLGSGDIVEQLRSLVAREAE